MMKWSRLQLNTLPIIAIEADKAIQRLEQLILKVNLNAKFEDIEDLNNLRKSIIERIDALDRFYELHYLDSTIAIFHMIKIKLKRAISRIDNIDNETMSIQFLNNKTRNNQTQNIKSNSSLLKKQLLRKTNEPRAQIIKQSSKSNSKFRLRQREKSRENIMKLLQTSRRQEENDTNLMQEINSNEGNGQTFYDDFKFQSDDPLFRPQKKNIPTNKMNSRQKNQKLNHKVSPIKNPSKFRTQNKTQSSKQFPIKPQNSRFNHATLPNTNALNHKKASIQPQRLQNKKIIKQKQTKILKNETKNPKLKTQAEQTFIGSPQNQAGEFRFTIKMSRQQYVNLLKLKQSMKNNNKT